MGGSSHVDPVVILYLCSEEFFLCLCEAVDSTEHLALLVHSDIDLQMSSWIRHIKEDTCWAHA